MGPLGDGVGGGDVKRGGGDGEIVRNVFQSLLCSCWISACCKDAVVSVWSRQLAYKLCWNVISDSDDERLFFFSKETYFVADSS